MKIHPKIYLQYYDEDGKPEKDVAWCEIRQLPTDIEYAVLAPQPIETCDKSNDLLLLYADVWTVGYWNLLERCWTENDMDTTVLNPTHWLPLPPTPQTPFISFNRMAP
jgi:hypothetical protein